MNVTLAAALDYHARGLCIVPMTGKKPALRTWKPYQIHRPNERQVRGWFDKLRSPGIGVIFGSVSGGLVSRDFDTMAGYDRWAAEYPNHAATLPTVETRRGRHVYAIAEASNVAELRASIGKPHGTGAIACGDGELRPGTGCYSVLPPSKHPLGHVYRWLIPLGDVLPKVDLLTVGFLPCNREDRGLLRGPMTLSGDEAVQHAANPCPESSRFSLSSAPSLLHDCHDPIELAIVRCLPTGHGLRHRLLFDLARELKAIPSICDADFAELRPIVKRWHELALPYIQTKPFEESWFDFCEGWGKVRHPRGKGPIAEAYAAALGSEPPIVAAQYDQPELRNLVTLCRELQRASGVESFFLACRTAAGLIGRDHTTVARWLRGLAHDKVIRLEVAGDRSKRRASRYHYCGD